MHLSPLTTCTALALMAVIGTVIVPVRGLGAVKPHPRLLFTPADQTRIESLAKTDETLARLIDTNGKYAESLLKKAPVQYRIPDGKRLLSESRTCIQTVTTTAMAYRLGGDKRFADRAIRDMLAAAAFKDWNPSHFLDTAEMTTALAIGYDWLQNALTDAQKQTIREAIVRHGLQPGMSCYKKGGWWVRGHNNWNQVCNGGMIIGALAVQELEPTLASEIIRAARKSIPGGLAMYPPDGAYPEGPGYWHYGTVYSALTMNALHTAQGDDLGISKSAGLDRTGYYWIHMLGPTQRFYNYADCGESWSPAPVLLELDRLYDQPGFTWWHERMLGEWLKTRGRLKNRFAPLEIAWYRQPGPAPSAAELPLDALFRGVQDVVTMRSAWNNGDALFVGFKGGYNAASHGHLDIGSFVLDADGVRWASDLGGDNYNMPGYFGGKRWSYYRLNNRSHNTLVIDNKLQDPRAKARITHFNSSPERVEAVTDMTEAYKGQASSVMRGVAMLDRKAVLVQDDIVGLAGEARWGMVTRTEVTLDGSRAILSASGKKLQATILSPRDARFELVSTRPPTPAENGNRGTRMLALRVKGTPNGRCRIAVLFQADGTAIKTPELENLSDW